MAKLTIDILLKKGLPKSNQLKDLKTLNLSKMQLETKDIDSQLFSQMVNLEELDISKNNLSELPGKLSLPKLKVLNLSDNQVEDVVVLQQFPSLEEVMYEENLYLTVSDNYKVCCLLPKLRRLNNKLITSLANHIRFVNHRELSSRVESYWENKYKDKLPDEPTPAMIKSISKEFLKSVGNHVKYGPNSLKDFTKWKVQIIAENLISSLLGEKKKSSEPKCEQESSSSDSEEASVTPSKKQTQKAETDCEVRAPSKRLRSNAETNCEPRSSSKRLRSSAEPDFEGASPTKRLRSSDVLGIVSTPRRSSKLQESPLKCTPGKSKQDRTPVKEKAPQRLLTPAKVSLRSTPLKQAVDRTVTSEKGKKDLSKKVQIIAENLISSLLGEKKKSSEPKCEQESSSSDSEEASVTPSKKQTQKAETDCEVRTPSKRLRSNAETNCELRSSSKRLRSSAEPDCEGASPTKRLRSSEVLGIVLTPRQSSKLQESPLKCTPGKSKQDSTPVKEKAPQRLLTPTKVSLRSTPIKQAVDRTVTSEKGKKDLSKKKRFDLEPLHFLQSHSKNNDSDDFSTQLWSCAFQPNLDSSPSSKVIASCGGESVCVIDCETGKVLKKYKVPGEEFFTLAWTTLTMFSKKKINVLAAGGKFGIVKLMHPEVGLCYGEIKAHKKAISIMCFSPTQDTFLFTGSYDKRIILWDIGVPDHEYNFKASQLLTLDTTSTPLRLCPVPASPDKHLMAACEDGCFVWDITLKKQQGRSSYEAEFNFPIYNKESKDTDFHIVDGLAFLSDDLVVSKSAMQESIYIWSWKKSFTKSKSKSSRKLEAHILAELKWSETDLPYLALTTTADGYCVLCGDEAGKVWIYDLESCRPELQNGVPSKALKKPTKIIDWPFPIAGKEKVGESVINTVLVDPAMEYLVALTDKNIIAIWKIL